MSLNENFFEDTETFNATQGLAIAAAYVDEEETMLNPEKGELAFYYNEWGYDEQGEIFDRFEKIPHRQCTDEDLGLHGGKNAQFFPMSEKVKLVVEPYKHLY